MKVLVIIASIFFFCSSTIAQNILTDGKLPTDLKITIHHTGTVQFATYYRYTISPEGSVTIEYTRRGLPPARDFSTLLAVKAPKPAKTAKSGKNSKKLKAETAIQTQKPVDTTATQVPPKKDKLSTGQLIKLSQTIESSGFFDMNDNYQGNPDLETATCVNHAAAQAISVTANGKTKNVYFFLGCGYGEFEPLKKFLALFQQIETAISSVNIKEVQPSINP